MTGGAVVLVLAAPLLASVGGAAVIGAVRWLRAVTTAVGKLTAVAEVQAQTAGQLAEVQRQLSQFARTCDERWHRIGGLIPHPRWADAEDRPAPVPDGAP